MFKVKCEADKMDLSILLGVVFALAGIWGLVSSIILAVRSGIIPGFFVQLLLGVAILILGGLFVKGTLDSNRKYIIFEHDYMQVHSGSEVKTIPYDKIDRVRHGETGEGSRKLPGYIFEISVPEQMTVSCLDDARLDELFKEKLTEVNSESQQEQS